MKSTGIGTGLGLGTVGVYTQLYNALVGKLLLEDGTSYILLENGSDKLLFN